MKLYMLNCFLYIVSCLEMTPFSIYACFLLKNAIYLKGTEQSKIELPLAGLHPLTPATAGAVLVGTQL